MAFGSILRTIAAPDILLYLLEHGNTPTTRVQKDTGVSHDAFYAAVDTLEGHGFVYREERTRGRRYVYLGLTRDGERLARTLLSTADLLAGTRDALSAEYERLEREGGAETAPRRIRILRLLMDRESAGGRWDAAKATAARLASLARLTGDLRHEAEAWLALGRIAQRRDVQEEAEKALRRALRLATSAKAPSVACEAEYLIGSSLARQSRWTQALERFAAVASRAERSGDALWRARAREATARAYARQGRSADAIPLLEEAAAEYERLGSEEDLPRTYVNRGSASYRLDRPDALAWFEKAVEVARRVGDIRMEAYAMSNAAAPLIDRRQLRKADQYLHRARTIFEDLGERSGLGGIDLNLGNVYAAYGRWTDAEEAFDRAEQEARKGNGRFIEASVRFNRGQMLKRRGRADEARAELEAGRRIFTEIGSTDLAARCDEELRDLTARRTR